MNTIEIKNENVDWGDPLDGGDKCILAIYKKNKVWHAYGSFEITGEEGYDELIDEIVSECSISPENIKMVKGLYFVVKEVSLKQHLNRQKQQKIAATKKRIKDAEQKLKALKKKVG